jgi:hypothetical protein
MAISIALRPAQVFANYLSMKILARKCHVGTYRGFVRVKIFNGNACVDVEYPCNNDRKTQDKALLDALILSNRLPRMDGKRK